MSPKTGGFGHDGMTDWLTDRLIVERPWPCDQRPVPWLYVNRDYRVYWPWPCEWMPVPLLYVTTEHWPWPYDQRSVPWLYASTEYWPWPCDQRSVPFLYGTTEYTDLDHVTRGLYLAYMGLQSILTLSMWPEVCTLPIWDYRVYWPWPCVQMSVPCLHVSTEYWPWPCDHCTLIICEYRVLTLTM